MAQINESGQIIAGIRNVRADDSVDECGCSQSWLSRGSIFEPFFRVRALNAILSELAQQETNDPHFYYASGCVLPSSAQRGQATCVSSPTTPSSRHPAGTIAAWSPCCVVVAPHRHVYTAQTYG